MDQDIKNNEKSALVHQYSFFEAAGGGAYNKTYICEITTYFCSLTVIENIMHHS